MNCHNVLNIHANVSNMIYANASYNSVDVSNVTCKCFECFRMQMYRKYEFHVQTYRI